MLHSFPVWVKRRTPSLLQRSTFDRKGLLYRGMLRARTSAHACLRGNYWRCQAIHARDSIHGVEGKRKLAAMQWFHEWNRGSHGGGETVIGCCTPYVGDVSCSPTPRTQRFRRRRNRWWDRFSAVYPRGHSKYRNAHERSIIERTDWVT